MNIRVLVVIGLLALIPLWIVPFYSSHDGVNHLARFAAYYLAFTDGSIIPRWAGNLNFGFGSPVLNFFYPLPGYIASLLHIVGLSYELSFKVIISVAFITSGISFYLWISRKFNSKTAFWGSVIYMFLPYHFLDLYVRGDIGELTALSVLPLVFYFIEREKKESSYVAQVGIAASYAALILSHNGISLMATPLIILYSLLFSSNKKIRIHIVISLAAGLALSSFFWIPALYEQRYVNGRLFTGQMYKEHFPSFLSLIYSPWGFGPNVNVPGGLSPQLGIIPILIAFGGFLWLSAKKLATKEIFFWLGMLVGYIFLVTPASTLVWSKVALLQVYQFPWRFVALASFSLSVLICFVLNRITHKMLLVSIGVIVLLSSLFYLKIQQTPLVGDSYFDSFTGTTYFHGEASPIWSAGDPSHKAKNPVEIISGTGEVGAYNRLSQKGEYSILAKGNVTVKDNTLYYPGWKVFSDGKEIPIQFQDQNHRGLITYSLPNGEHTIRVEFHETKVRLFADILSISSALGLVVYFLTHRKKYGKKK